MTGKMLSSNLSYCIIDNGTKGLKVESRDLFKHKVVVHSEK